MKGIGALQSCRKGTVADIYIYIYTGVLIQDVSPCLFVTKRLGRPAAAIHAHAYFAHFV